MDASLVPNPDNPDDVDLVLHNVTEINLSGLSPMDCAIYGMGILRQHLGEALDEVEKALDMDDEDIMLPISMIRELLDTLEIIGTELDRG